MPRFSSEIFAGQVKIVGDPQKKPSIALQGFDTAGKQVG